MHKVGLYFILGILFLCQELKAQEDSIPKNLLFLEIDNLNFVKDNEYSNNIADGYMLIGSQLHPKLVFYPHPKAKLELGLFGLTYAGLDKYHKTIPTFSFSYLMEKSSFIMGNFYSKKSHNLIAPLLTKESQLDDRFIENGLQYLFKTKNIEIDTWLNWEHFIFKNDTQNEEFILGLNTLYTPLKNNNWSLNVSFQNLFYHRGGQINTDEFESRNVFTMRHTALGILINRQLAFNKKFIVSSYIIQHQTPEKPEEFIFKKGNGYLTRLNYIFNDWTIGIGYWYGSKFVSPRGDDMFQSVSTKVDYNFINGEVYEVYENYTEPNRSLILGNISYKKEILPNIKIKAKTNFFFQNYYSRADLIDTIREVNNKLDFSLALSFFYQGNFTINNK